jgi:hypothetical protein
VYLGPLYQKTAFFSIENLGPFEKYGDSKKEFLNKYRWQEAEIDCPKRSSIVLKQNKSVMGGSPFVHPRYSVLHT